MSASSTSQFFKQINTIIDWKPIEEYLVNHYKPGKKQRGQKAYHPMILFKPDFRVEIRPKPLPGLKKAPFPTVTLMDTFCSDQYQ